MENSLPVKSKMLYYFGMYPKITYTKVQKGQRLEENVSGSANSPPAIQLWFMLPMCRHTTPLPAETRGFSGGTRDVIPLMGLPGELDASRALVWRVPRFGEGLLPRQGDLFGPTSNIEHERVLSSLQHFKGVLVLWVQRPPRSFHLNEDL